MVHKKWGVSIQPITFAILTLTYLRPRIRQVIQVEKEISQI